MPGDRKERTKPRFNISASSYDSRFRVFLARTTVRGEGVEKGTVGINVIKA